MSVTELRSPALNKPLGGYSHAMKVSNPRNLVFVSGLTSRDTAGKVVGVGDIKLQTKTVIENLQHALAEGGMTLKNIVKLTVFIRDMNMFAAIHEVRGQYFSEPYPASTMVEVSRMVSPEHLIEIDAIAAD